MLITIGIILLIIWGGGLILHLLGGFIHIFLVLALISFIFRMFSKPQQ